MNPTPGHQPWCEPAGHVHAVTDPAAEACVSAALRLDFEGAAEHMDSVRTAAVSLFHTTVDGTTVNVVINGFEGFSLQRGHARPLALALLAYDALQAGDPAAAELYRSEALRAKAGA